MNIKKSHWIELIILFFILFFLAPLTGMGILPDWFRYVVYIPMACVGVIFFLYPFVKGIIEIRNKNTSLGILLIIFGIVVPAVSGFISIVVIEIAGNKEIVGKNT